MLGHIDYCGPRIDCRPCGVSRGGFALDNTCIDPQLARVTGHRKRCGVCSGKIREEIDADGPAGAGPPGALPRVAEDMYLEPFADNGVLGTASRLGEYMNTEQPDGTGSPGDLSWLDDIEPSAAAGPPGGPSQPGRVAEFERAASSAGPGSGRSEAF